MRVCGAAVLCGLIWTAAAQDLAPEVILVARIKTHLRDEVARIPNYTCLETITRFHRRAAPGAKLQPLDSVRLEIAYSDGREWYGSPGDRGFSQENPASFTGAGMIANGIFAITLHNLFVSDAAVFTFRGEGSVDGHAAVKFDFRLPRLVNKLEVSLQGGKGIVGEEGSFWADRQSLDLVRLEVRAAEIPEFLPLADMEFTVKYARTRIGEFDAMLAQQADLRMRHAFGYEDFDRLDFTHCRVFHTSSAIRFDTGPYDPAKAPAEAPPQVAASPEPDDSVPALLPVTIQLMTTITDRDAVGKLIEGRVAGDVQRKGKVAIEDGAPVRGRIRRLDRYGEGERFVVGLEFTEVQAHGTPLRFYADLLRLEKRKGIEVALQERVRLPNQTVRDADIVLPELPGVASFFVEGRSFVLPAGFRTFWRTRGLLRGVN